MKINIEQRGENVAVGWAQGRSHAAYEDRYRMLTHHIPLVAEKNVGEILAVCDGVGSAPRGVQAAQTVVDVLLSVFTTATTEPVSAHVAREGDAIDPTSVTGREAELPPFLHSLMNGLAEAQATIRSWGLMEDSDRPQGAAAATIACITRDASAAHIFHAGDTLALLVGEDGSYRQLSSLDQAPGGELINYFGAPNMRLRHSHAHLRPGDRLLLTSDGVTKVLSNSQLAERTGAAIDPKSLCLTVLNNCQMATSDDITFLVYEVE